jgi:hypothetical protein
MGNLWKQNGVGVTSREMLAGRQSVELLSIASVQKIFAKLSSLQYITLARKKLIGT